MVTKQQQLEWLAKKYCIWPVLDGAPIRMSSVAIGEVNNGLGVAHHIRMDEWQQERDKMSSKPEVDNSWYERGELPPVGCECEMKHTCWDEFQHVFVLAITKEYVIVSDHSTPAIEQHYHLREMTFRPLSTERKKAIEEIASYFCDADGCQVTPCVADIISTRLYDVGYRKLKS